MKRPILFLVLLIPFLFSCEKLERPTKDPELGEFEMFEKSIDTSQKNRYKESRFYHHWVLSAVSREVYLDGQLESSNSESGLGEEEFSLYKDHTMTYFKSKGIWLYSHDYLFLKHDGSYYAYSVENCRFGSLVLKEEEYTQGNGGTTPFWIDKSGKHTFYVYKFKAK